MTHEEAEKPRSSQAPGQLLGYSMQFTRLTHLLLEKGVDWVLSLECFSDVGGQSKTGQRLAEEDKSTHTGNPLADRSRDLWKTLFNWVVSVEDGKLNPSNTSFIIYISRQVEGAIANAFSAAQTSEEARAALEQAQVLLWGEAPDFTLRESVAKQISPYVKKVFSTDPNLVSEIVRHFEIGCGSGSPTADLRHAFARLQLMPPEQLDSAMKFATGWIKIKADLQLEASEPATITGEEFFSALTNYVFNRSTRTVLRSVAGIPSESETRIEFLSRVFVRQLDIIDEPDEEKLSAVRDWWRSKGDCISWVRDGYIDPDAIGAFSRDLMRRWEHERGRLPLLRASLGESEQGQLLYRSCSCMRVPLDGLPVESHVVCGTYHDLADSLKVGWHPNFREILGRQDQTEVE